MSSSDDRHGDTPNPDPDLTRLNRWFTDQGICSRREADRWIETGRVTINGKKAELGTKVGPSDRIAVDGKIIVPADRRPVVIAYNKPVGVESTSDPKVPNNLIDAVAYPERLVHIGRLDVMSEGLILLTNRGEIVNGILRSEFEHEKEYVVELSTPVSDEEIMRMARGLDIGDGRGRTKPCVVERLGAARLRMVLTEGRNRQIRKMAEAIGNHVRRLERQRIMHIRLADLPRGKWRHLSADEMRDLFLALGLERPKGSLRPPDTRPTLPRNTVVPVDTMPEPRARRMFSAPRSGPGPRPSGGAHLGADRGGRPPRAGQGASPAKRRGPPSSRS